MGRRGEVGAGGEEGGGLGNVGRRTALHLLYVWVSGPHFSHSGSQADLRTVSKVGIEVI